MTAGTFFIENVDIVHFFYGLAFTFLGISIFAQLRATRKSRYKLVDILWLLAAFALIHGAHEFIEMSVLKDHVRYLDAINFVAIISSYGFLFLFGFRLVNIAFKAEKLSAWFEILVVALFLGLPLVVGPTSFTVWTNSARYFFGFTGAILSAVGLLLYYRCESKTLAKTSIRKYFVLAALSFVVYAFSAGLVVKPADFAPASLLNTDSFMIWFGFSVQLLRALAAVGIAWSIWQIVNIFNLEQAAERDMAERDLLRAHDELEVRVKERTSQLGKSKELSDSLNRINGAINSTLDFETIMRTVVNESSQAMKSEAVGILLREDDDWVVSHTYGLPDQMTGRRLTAEEARPVILAAKTKEPFVSDDACSDPRLDCEAMTNLHIMSLLALPLIVRGEVPGVLYFMHHSAPEAFTETQVDFGRKLAVSVSLAFENARLYATEHYIAETLQETLLTMPKEMPGVVFSHKYQSATEIAKVGGDFYDIFEVAPEKIGIIVGDVSGKGVQASALTSIVKSTIKAHAYETSRLSEAIGKTNDMLLKTTKPGLFVTVFFGVLDTGSGVLRYCNAGHPPPVVKRKNGQSLFLSEGSPVIGVSDVFTFIEGEETLHKGDLLVAYTDGVIEARHDAELFGEERLLHLIEKLDVGAEEMTDRVYSGILKFAGGKLTDDIAVLSLSLRGQTRSEADAGAHTRI